MKLFGKRNRRLKLKVGQEWHYQTRSVEPESTLVVGRIEQTRSGTVVHVSIRNLRIANPNTDSGISTAISHLPMSEEAIVGSVTKVKGEALPDGEFESGYQEWLQATGGAFSVSVAEAISTVEDTLVAAAGRAT